jgi:hypothetical protein
VQLLARQQPDPVIMPTGHSIDSDKNGQQADSARITQGFNMQTQNFRLPEIAGLERQSIATFICL